jgi:hypothetical protein
MEGEGLDGVDGGGDGGTDGERLGHLLRVWAMEGKHVIHVDLAI